MLVFLSGSEAVCLFTGQPEIRTQEHVLHMEINQLLDSHCWRAYALTIDWLCLGECKCWNTLRKIPILTFRLHYFISSTIDNSLIIDPGWYQFLQDPSLKNPLLAYGK